MKGKPSKRFEHVNDLVDRIAPTMPSAAYVAVLLVAWRHARNKHFRVSAKQFSTQACISLRQARYVLDDLERADVIHLVADRKGTLPKVYRFTGKTMASVALGAPLEPKQDET
jgi:hypothetical protein